MLGEVARNLPTPDDPFEVPLHRLPGVTDHRAELLRRLGVLTVGDLLFHFPRAYEDLSDRRPIANLTANTIQTVEGEIVEIESRELNNGGFIISVVLSDGGPTCLEAIWFNQAAAARRFRFGMRVTFSGKPRWFRDHWQMNTPRVQILDSESAGMGPAVVPVYPLTEDLRPETLRPLIGKALDRYAPAIADRLPAALRQRHNWPPVAEALRTVHFPTTIQTATNCRRRFVYEEFLILQLALSLRRREVRDRRLAPVLPTTPGIDSHIRRLFPFQLTGDQEKAVADVVRDLASERPMQRLVQADVGAGKTAVAVYALLVAVANKHQAALMAPTEVLARQHFLTLERYLAHSRVRRLLLTGSLKPRARAEALERLKNGDVDLVVGTQALVQEGVQFAKLGLVVIDEQHKFGVHQRARVRKLGADPHYLVMTATPIPRTVALTVFGDLDVSIIREMPPGRQKVVTRWLQAAQRDWVHGKLREGLMQGRQGYVICPLVEESAVLDVKAATETHAELQAGTFRDFRLGLLHGRMDEEEKAALMEEFRAREAGSCSGLYSGCRSRRGRGECDADADRTCRAFRSVAIAPVARADQSRHGGRPVLVFRRDRRRRSSGATKSVRAHRRRLRTGRDRCAPARGRRVLRHQATRSRRTSARQPRHRRRPFEPGPQGRLRAGDERCQSLVAGTRAAAPRGAGAIRSDAGVGRGGIEGRRLLPLRELSDMPSPFPGMDPYLEGSEWMSFHGMLCGADWCKPNSIPRPRPRYRARNEKRFRE